MRAYLRKREAGIRSPLEPALRSSVWNGTLCPAADANCTIEGIVAAILLEDTYGIRFRARSQVESQASESQDIVDNMRIVTCHAGVSLQLKMTARFEFQVASRSFTCIGLAEVFSVAAKGGLRCRGPERPLPCSLIRTRR